jgi:Tfp pilus assembly protein PilF
LERLRPEPWAAIESQAHKDGHLQDAADAARRLQELDWTEYGPNCLAADLGELGRYDEGIDAVNEAIRRNPRSSVAYGILGHLQAATDKIEEGRKSFQRSLEIDPHNTVAALGLAEVYIKESRVLEASLVLEKLPSDPPDADVLRTLIRCYKALGDKDAETHARERLKASAPMDFNRFK